jgi:alpha-aminoadipic semialdehyde synthase
MKPTVGIRREDKSIWERRVPITPQDARDLQTDYGLTVIAQTSEIRVFEDDEYLQTGTTVQEDLSAASTVFAVKEIPLELFERDKTYVFFAHVIKGQPYNMPMLKRMMELGCNLIDYEKVTDDKGRRLIFFGQHAGWAGMIDTLWAFGQRMAWRGTPNPFTQLRQTYRYKNLDEAIVVLEKVKGQIEDEGLPEAISPLILGIAGYGNVSGGAQEILAHLPTVEIAPDEIAAIASNPQASRHVLYKAVFKEEHMVDPLSPDDRFELQDYYQHPEKYRSKFETYLPYLNILVNAIYWDKMYPRLVTKDYVKRAYAGEGTPRLQVIGDISCDVEGAIEVTVRSTEPDKPRSLSGLPSRMNPSLSTIPKPVRRKTATRAEAPSSWPWTFCPVSCHVSPRSISAACSGRTSLPSPRPTFLFPLSGSICRRRSNVPSSCTRASSLQIIATWSGS